MISILLILELLLYLNVKDSFRGCLYYYIIIETNISPSSKNIAYTMMRCCIVNYNLKIISELHYKNIGPDEGQFIEIAHCGPTTVFSHTIRYIKK